MSDTLRTMPSGKIRLGVLAVLLACLLQSSLCVITEPGANSEINDATVFKLNKGIDFLFTVARWIFTKKGQLTLKMPEIHRPFGHDVYKGQFNATGGYFKNIGSLHRTGDIAFVKENSSLSLEVALGMSELEVGYTNYTLGILLIKQTGNMTLTVKENSLRMKMTYTYSPKCKFFVELIEFDKLDGIKVDVTGLGAFQLFYNELSTWLISNFEERFRTISNAKMKEKLNDVVNEKSDMLCRYFPSF